MLVPGFGQARPDLRVGRERRQARCRDCSSPTPVAHQLLAPVAKVLTRSSASKRVDDDRPLLHQRSARCSICRTKTPIVPGRRPKTSSDFDRRGQSDGQVIPELKGKLTGISLRVPTPTGSVVDLTPC